MSALGLFTGSSDCCISTGHAQNSPTCSAEVLRSGIGEEIILKRLVEKY